MDSTSMRSPPTPCASAARSEVAGPIFILPAECTGIAHVPSASAHNRRQKDTFRHSLDNFMINLLKRMRAVRPENEDKLEQQFIAVPTFSEMSEPVLAADLAELAGPVSQHP